MRAVIAILAGAGLGAAAMYLFDPQGGGRRRALIRDKAVKFNRQARETFEGTVSDLSNRAKGTAHGLHLSLSSDDAEAQQEISTR